jgi:hypothetical protein
MDSRNLGAPVGTDTVITFQAFANSCDGNASWQYDSEETDTPERFVSLHHPNTIKLRANILLRECRLYINSFPGGDNLVKNVIFNQYIRAFISGRLPPTEENLDGIYRMVMYRNNSARLATNLLDAANIPQPNGVDIFDFDREAFQRSMSPATESRLHAALYSLALGLLPGPIKDERNSEGRCWGKPTWYIAAAIAVDPSIKDKADIIDAVERMRTCTYT